MKTNAEKYQAANHIQRQWNELLAPLAPGQHLRPITIGLDEHTLNLLRRLRAGSNHLDEFSPEVELFTIIAMDIQSRYRQHITSTPSTQAP